MSPLKHLLPLLTSLLALVPNPAFAQFTYINNNGAITITGYNGPGGAVVIPNTINGLPVTGIAFAAFYHENSLTSVTIPDSVISIGDQVFGSCTSLTNVTLGNSVTNIGRDAFNGCNSLTTITIPDSVVSIGDQTFSGCASLATITLGTNLISIGRTAFNGCSSLLAVSIPHSVASIGFAAFHRCTSLNAITVDALNSAYSSVEGVLFNKSQTLLIACPTGKSGGYVVPMGVTSIESDAFGACNLTNVVISSGVTNMGNSAFSFCTNLTAITVSELNLFYRSLDGVLFDKDQTLLIQYPGGKIGNYTIPDSVANLGENAFASAVHLTGVTIPSSVSNIGDYAFTLCASLADVVVPNSITNIGNYAFALCYSLNSIALPNSVIKIGERAFYNCTNLANVSLLNGLTDIGDFAFLHCFKLTVATVPASVTNVGDYAFYSCFGLTNMAIGSNVASIGISAFGHCTRLTEISVDALNSSYSSVEGVLFNDSQTLLIQCPGGKVGSYMIPISVTTIESDAFYFCTNLTSVIIPGSVTNIGESAFSWCINMAGIYFMGNPPEIDPAVQTIARSATVYYLPGSTGWDDTFNYRPTALWQPQMRANDSNFGVKTNQFGFNITWASGQDVAVEACTNLTNPAWSPIQTNTLNSDVFYFTDPDWTNHPARFYRIRSP